VNYAQADDTDDSVERQWKQLKSETDSDTIPDGHDGGRNRAVLLEVNSVAAAFEVKQELDPLHLAETLNNTEWKNASTLYVKIKEPKATAHVFKSGKVNLIGCQNEELARIAGRRVARMIQVQGNYPDVTFAKFRVTTVTASAKLPFGINLTKFSEAYRHAGVEFEPEIFPSAIYRTKEPKATLHICHTGRVLVIGAESSLKAEEAVNQLYPLAYKYQKAKAKGKRGKTGQKARVKAKSSICYPTTNQKKQLEESIDWSDLE